jgi:DNA-binding NarL/FixJ family response regulator
MRFDPIEGLSKGRPHVSTQPLTRDEEETLAYFSPTPRETVRALLIDDDAADAAIISRLAAKSKQLDFKLRVSFTTEDALRVMAGRPFDVVFVDYWLGSQTSIAFISEFCRTHTTPCVLLTGLDEPDIRRIGFRAGVKAFLSKEEISAQAIESVTLAVLESSKAL